MKSEELLWLFSAAKEMESVAEIGSWKGRSTHALLSGCQGPVYAIDHFLGSANEPKAHAEAKTGDIYKTFTENVGDFKNLQVMKMAGAEAVHRFEDNSVDMVFIDGGHTYEEVLTDIKQWLPKAKKMICGHDFLYPDVEKAVTEIFGKDIERNIEKNGNIWIKRIQKANEKENEKEKAGTVAEGENAYDLSILIPAKNEEFLGRTIEDILKNKRGKTEVIAILDGYDREVPVIPKDPHVRVIVNEKGIGQRAATNQACRLSNSKYVMKVDAHCAFDEGFDVKMIKEMHDDWTMVPIMRNLHAFDWVCEEGHRRYQGPSGPCQECGKPTAKDVVWIAKRSPQSTSYCFDETPHFQYFQDFKQRPEGKGDITETMSLQGSCFMLTRDKYWDLNISDEKFGSWGSQGIEVACKTWLSGGRVVVNHKTWYAHMFRTQGGDFGFPYNNPGRKVEQAKKTARELFFDNKWEKQVRPLSWLLERFWPVPGWSEEARQKIKEWPLQNGKVFVPPAPTEEDAAAVSAEPHVAHSESENENRDMDKKPTVGIIYYTDNMMDEKVMKACQKQLLLGANGKKIVSVSLKPMNFGENVVLPLERGYLTMFKQILLALKTIDTDVVFFCEHDVFYHPSHFDFVPPKNDVWYYNTNYWCIRHSDGFALHFNASPLSGLCLYRDIAIKHYEERVAMVEKDGFSYHIGFEPMTHGRIKWKNFYKCEHWQSAGPNLDIKHGKNLTRARWSQDLFRRKPTVWIESDVEHVPGWKNLRSLLEIPEIPFGG